LRHSRIKHTMNVRQCRLRLRGLAGIQSSQLCFGAAHKSFEIFSRLKGQARQRLYLSRQRFQVATEPSGPFWHLRLGLGNGRPQRAIHAIQLCVDGLEDARPHFIQFQLGCCGSWLGLVQIGFH
jgi:hypothetical protein